MGLTLYPIVSNYINQKYTSEIHTAYQEVMEQADDHMIQEAKEKAAAYNRAIVPGAAETYSQEGLQAASQDYDSQLNIAGNGIMGYIEIPKISVNLPIYHGTESDSLERGIGHLLGSSLPIGGENTHSILSGHSGMASQKMFTDLEQLIRGDVFYLHILDETLAYQVVAINTVLPYDTSLLGISPGEDLCTLVTCTPYGVNTHRLLVQGSRIPCEEAEKAQEETVPVEQSVSSWEQHYLNGLVIGLAVAVILVAGILLITRPRKRRAKGGRYARKPKGGRYTSKSKGGHYARKSKGGRYAKEKTSRLPHVLLIIVLLTGLIFLLYPYLRGAVVDRSIVRNAEGFLNTSEKENPPTESAVEIAGNESESKTPAVYPELWADMCSYNNRIFSQGQTGLSCAYNYQQPSFRLSDYGLDSEVFGVISIPAMDLEMPIYLGATEQHMAAGAAHLSQTSLPIGGENTNCVIAGHRGYNGASYFRYIDKLKVGDTVSVTNLWETLNYRVAEIKIIDPNEVSQILIQPGRELLTLLTCHPYASGGRQRYVVYCDRILNP